MVDTQGCYAPLEVDGDEMPTVFLEHLERLSGLHAAMLFEAVRRYPYLSPEGRRERLAAILASRRVSLRFEAEPGSVAT